VVTTEQVPLTFTQKPALQTVQTKGSTKVETAQFEMALETQLVTPFADFNPLFGGQFLQAFIDATSAQFVASGTTHWVALSKKKPLAQAEQVQLPE
jgi:hypothetical protein